MPRSPTVAVYIPSARCGADAQREAYLFADRAEEKLGIKVIRVERQLAYDLHPDFSERQAEDFCIGSLGRILGEG